MERVGICDARARLWELIERVRFGEEVVLTLHGQPVARLVLEKLRRKRSRVAAVWRIRTLARKLNICGVDVRPLIEENRR